MTADRRGCATIARWTTCLVLGPALGAVLGSFVGMLIGDAIGTPEGEGFIGFILGMRSGAALGLLLGGLLAWRWGRRRRARGALQRADVDLDRDESSAPRRQSPT